MKYSEIYGVKKKEASTGEKIKDTTLDVLANLGTGVSRSLEGIVDYGMGIVGGIGGIWDKDFKDRVQKNIEYDWTGETLGANRWQEELDDSVLKSGGFTENVLQGIGGMLPSIAVSFIPGVGAGLAMGTMGVGAAGQSMQDALNSGADYDKAFGYGTVSGAIEAATEKIGGFTFGGGSSLTGKILAKTGKGTLLKKGIGKAAETFVSEGAEEVLSDLLDPVNKAVFDIGDQSFSENMGEAVKGLPQTFLVGGTVGTVMQGGNDIIRGVSNNQRGGFNANKADDFIEYKNDLAKNYTADENNNAKFDAETDKAYNEVSAALKKMTPEKRSEYLKSIGAEAMAFDDDGNVVAKRAKSINNEAITGNLRAVSGNLLHAPLDVNTPITEGAKAAKNAVEKALGADARVVVSEMDDGENASFDIKNGTIYFNNNSENLEEKASAIAIAFHELTHTTEGTEAYNELQKTLSELAFDENVPESIKAKMGDLDKRKLEIINNYNLGVGEKDAYILNTELSADLVGELIGSEYFADKLALRNKPLAEKMFSKIKDLLTGKGDKIDNQTRKYLNKVYKSFAKALDKSVGGVSLSMFDGDDDEKAKAEEDAQGVRFSIKDDTLVKKYPALDLNQDISELDGVPAIRLEDGSVLPFTEIHVQFIKNNGIDVEDIESGGWISNGVYEASQNSDTLRYKERMLAKKRMDAKRAEKNDESNGNSEVRYSLREESGSAYEYEQTIRFSLVKDKKTLYFLNNQKHITVYRAMQVIDGKLYPPMAAKIKGDDGKTSLVESTQFGKWYQADEHPELVVNGKFTLNKGNGSSITAAYNPYWHTSKSPLNDQFTSAYKRDNLVTVECEVPESELTSGYKAEGAKDTVGEMSWHSGQVSSKLSGEKTRKVILSRWVKVNRIVPDSEVASKIAKLLDGENVSIPDNTITPSLRTELEKLGVEITKSGKVEYENNLRHSLKDSEGRTLTEAQQKFFKDSKSINQDGELLTLYHGGFSGNVFNGRGKGFTYNPNAIYLTDSKQVAEAFANGGVTREFYANIKNPIVLDAQGRSYVDIPIPEDAPESLKEYFYETADMDNLPVYAEKYGYDGVIVYNVKEGVGGEPMTEVVVLQSNQVKLTTNENPTFNPDIRYSIKYPKYTQEDIDRNISDIAKMDAVANIDESKLKKTGKKPFDLFLEYFDALGNNIASSTFGDIALNRASVKSEIRHGITAEKIASLEAIPAVIEQGKVIFSKKKPGTDVDRIVIAAPIKIGDADYYMGVMLQRDTQNQRLYLHNVVAIKAEEATTLSQDDSLTNWSDESDSRLFITSILQKALDVKRKQKENSDNIRQSKTKSDIYKDISSKFNESIKRRTVNESMLKRYTLTDSDKIITEIMGELGFYDEYSDIESVVSLTGKSKAEAIRALTDGLNSKKEGERAGVVEEVADIIMKNAIATQIINESDETAYARTVLQALKPFLHNMNLDYIKGDIEVKYDKDKSVYALWGRGKNSKRSGKPYTADEVAQALEAEGIRVEATNEADIFLEIDQMYRDALAVLKSYIPSKSQFKSILSESEYKKIKNDIKNEILRQADNYGAQTQLAKTIEKYQGRIENLKEKNKEIREKVRLENSILYYAKSIGGMKQGKFANATQVQSAAIEEMRKLVSKLVVRDNINRSSVRKIFGKIKDFYSEFAKDGNPFHEFYMEDMAEVIDAFSQVEGNKVLSENELEIIKTALAHIDHIFKNYTKVYKNGKLVDGEDIVKQQIEIAEEAGKDKSTLVKWLTENKYSMYFNDPSSVMQALDGYNENGFHSSTLRDLQDGAIKRAAISMDLHSELDAFAKKHKKYIKSLKKDKINVGARLEGEFEGNPRIKNIEVPRGVALSLYMTSKRTQAMKTLDEIGWRFTDKDGKGVRCGTLTAEQVKSLEEGFTDEDKQFIKICEDIYSKCKDIKMEVDFRRLGASNVIDGYYYPIRRYIRDKAEKDFVSEMKTVSGLSFNKNTVKGAKIELVISDALSVLENHIDGISRYAGFAEAIDTMDRLYNLDISGNPNLPVSIKSTLDASNRKGYEYLKTLVRDMQGLDNRTDLASKAVSYMRGAFAKFQLGFNPKVLFTQSTSYVAAFGELGANSLLKGIGISGKDVDKYCDLAAIRNYDGSAAKAMAVDTGRGVSKVGDALMKPISMADRFIVERLFGACQYEAYSKYHLDIGTEENKQKAGEILTRVILNTQQNALATEWSAAMRSPSEIARTVTMFSADAMKTISRWFDAIGRTATLKKKLKRLKASGDSAAASEVEAQIKAAKKKLVKQSAVLIMVSAYASLIAELFHFLYNKDDDDKETVLTHLYENFFGQLVGFFPVIRDIVSAFKDGFEVDNYAYSMINGVISSATNCYKAIEDAVSGKPVDSQTSNRNIRNLVYSLSQFAGIPARNVYNLTTGLIRRFSESTGYKIDNAFSVQSYQADFNKAISEGNDKLASTILNEWLSNRDVDITDEATKTEIMRLQKLETTKSANDTNSYDVIPSKVPSQISINGESYELTASEQEAFRTAYEEADKAVSKAVKDYRYKRMDDKSKAAVIRSIYNYYYQTERANLGADAPAVVLLGKAISIDKLSIILAYCKTLVGDKNRRQKIERYISSCGLTNAEKYIILGYLGYTNERGKSQVKYYVNKLSLTKDEKQKLMEYAGVA